MRALTITAAILPALLLGGVAAGQDRTDDLESLIRRQQEVERVDTQVRGRIDAQHSAKERLDAGIKVADEMQTLIAKLTARLKEKERQVQQARSAIPGRWESFWNSAPRNPYVVFPWNWTPSRDAACKHYKRKALEFIAEREKVDQELAQVRIGDLLRFRSLDQLIALSSNYEKTQKTRSARSVSKVLTKEIEEGRERLEKLQAERLDLRVRVSRARNQDSPFSPGPRPDPRPRAAKVVSIDPGKPDSWVGRKPVSIIHHVFDDVGIPVGVTVKGLPPGEHWLRIKVLGAWSCNLWGKVAAGDDEVRFSGVIPVPHGDFTLTLAVTTPEGTVRREVRGSRGRSPYFPPRERMDRRVNELEELDFRLKQVLTKDQRRWRIQEQADVLYDLTRSFSMAGRYDMARKCGDRSLCNMAEYPGGPTWRYRASNVMAEVLTELAAVAYATGEIAELQDRCRKLAAHRRFLSSRSQGDSQILSHSAKVHLSRAGNALELLARGTLILKGDRTLALRIYEEARQLYRQAGASTEVPHWAR